MIKKFLLMLCLVVTAGCASVSIPNYIPDQYPYKKKFFAPFEEVQTAITKSLEEMGWKVSGTADPSIFERAKEIDQAEGKQTLLFTEVRQNSLILGTRYARMNAYIRAGKDNSTEVELRYVTVSSVIFKSFYNYRKDAFIEKIFKRIDEQLK